MSHETHREERKGAHFRPRFPRAGAPTPGTKQTTGSTQDAQLKTGTTLATPNIGTIGRSPQAIERPITISFTIHSKHAPAFRSAVEEITNEVGGRLEGMFAFATEQALTDAAVALGSLRAATCAVIPNGDPHYKTR